MKNFVYIYHMDVNPDFVPSENAMANWMKWFETLGDKVVDSGNPFKSEQAQVKDQKVAMDVMTTNGYSVVKAENLEEAVKMAMGCPMAFGDDSWVEVYETMPM